MSAVDPTGPTVIATPEDGPAGGGLALLALVILALAVAASFVVPRTLPELVWADLAAKVVVVVAVIALATSIERGLPERSVAVSALTATLALIAGVAGGVGCLRLSPALGDRGALGLGFLAGGLWLSGLSIGTLLVRAVFTRGALEARVTRVLAVGFALAALSTIAGARAAPPVLEWVHQRAPDLFHVWSPYRERALSAVGPTGIWSLVTLLCLALPLALSGCRKLVRQTFEGLSVLEAAADTVAAGRLELQVEHQGASREVVALMRSYSNMLESLARVRGLERAFLPRSEAALARLRRHFPSAVLPPEERAATIVVAEIRELNELAQSTAPDRLAALVDRFFGAMLAAVDKHDGHVERIDASGFVALFNAPIEQADHMVRATRCAIECQTELVGINKGEDGPLSGKLALAIGVASGLVVAGTIEGNGQPRYVVIGETLELAARLANLTPSGQVWVNQRNAETLPMYLPSVMLAAISMRGRAHPVAPYRVWPPP